MSGMEYPVADQIIDINNLLKWIGLARAEIRRLRAERDAAASRAEAAEAAGFQRAISAALAVIDARHDKIAEAGTEFSPLHAGMVEALCWASDKLETLAAKAKTEEGDQ